MDGSDCSPPAGGCHVGEVFQLLGKTHMLDILHAAIHHDGPIRFVDLQKQLSMSPNTLSNRLKLLQEAGLLTRTVYNEIPPRVDYAPTQKAYDLRSVFKAIHEWASTHTLQADVTMGEAVEASA